MRRRERSISARLRWKLVRMQRSEDARQFARDWLREAEPEILRRVLASGDLRLILAAWTEMRRYAFGTPAANLNVHVNAGPSPTEVLMEILRERDRRARLSAAVTVETTALSAGTEPVMAEASAERPPEPDPAAGDGEPAPAAARAS